MTVWLWGTKSCSSSRSAEQTGAVCRSSGLVGLTAPGHAAWAGVMSKARPATGSGGSQEQDGGSGKQAPQGGPASHRHGVWRKAGVVAEGAALPDIDQMELVDKGKVILHGVGRDSGWAERSYPRAHAQNPSVLVLPPAVVPCTGWCGPPTARWWCIRWRQSSRSCTAGGRDTAGCGAGTSAPR